jgi:hypothetical protein
MAIPPRVALIVEGPTDAIVIRAILPNIVEEFEVTVIQPERTAIGGDFGEFGGGWRGVLRWCEGVNGIGGPSQSPTFANSDIVIVHLDADVSDEPEVSCRKPPISGKRPFSPTVDALRAVVVAQIGSPDPKLVLCIPHEATESWLLPILRSDLPAPESVLDPAAGLSLSSPRLCRYAQGKLKKVRDRYESIEDLITKEWPRVLASCEEAAVFDSDLRAAPWP